MATKNSKGQKKVATDSSQGAGKNKKPAKVRKNSGTPYSAAHLKPYQWGPGQSGNPGGRKVDVAAIFARKVFEEMTEAEVEAAAKAFRGKFKQGDAKAFQALGERGYGKQAQALEHSGPGGQPFAPPVVNIGFKSVDEVKAEQPPADGK